MLLHNVPSATKTAVQSAAYENLATSINEGENLDTWSYLP